MSQPAISDLILSLSSPEATLLRAGGKGANLARLTQAAFNVPPGFIVTTDAYRVFVESNQIGSTLLALAAAASPDDPNALEAASNKIRALFSAGTLPAEIAEAIRSEYAKLSPAGNLPVAVRSSATAEDLPGLSFAGQQDTFLNVVGPEALIEAVKACWGSLWTARAMGYRARSHIEDAEVALAVVVQTLIPSEVSGILFTANPLTGDRGQMVIDASFGLGEAIVSGQVEPDHYVVDSHKMKIISRKLGAKALAILPRDKGGTDSVSEQRQEQQALPDAQILELARLSARIAAHFGAPQDIEWAWASGQLFVLQSRPITSLYPLPESVLQSKDLRVLFSLNSLQGVVQPLTPLGRDPFRLVADGFAQIIGSAATGAEIMIITGGRLYLDMTGLLTNERLRVLALGMFANADPGAREAAAALIENGRIKTNKSFGPLQILRLLLRLRRLAAGMVLGWARPEYARRRTLAKSERYLDEARQALQKAPSLDARLAVLDHYASTMLHQFIDTGLLSTALVGVLSQFIVDHWLVSWAGAEPGTVRRLLRGLPGNPTTEMDLTLWATAQAIRSDTAANAIFQGQDVAETTKAYHQGNLPPAAQRAIQAFLDRYGMRAVREIDMGIPRWREDPAALLHTLGSYLQIGDPDLAPDRLFQRAGAEVEQLSAGYIDQVRRKKGWLKARLLRAVMRRMRLLSGFREMPKFHIIKVLDQMRTALLDSGQQLAAEAKLDCPEDIFFVPLETLRQAAQGQPVNLKAVVKQEREDYNRELARRQIPRLMLSTGEAFYQGVSGARPNDLAGDGVSPGTVEGKVRVVEDPRGVRLQPGEILVCPATDPGWTPLFLSAGGLVMELGGMMTHGSVVAREYGIPAVVGVHEATKRLKTGQRVRVDGSLGRVVVLDQ
jgi:pyruvate,water dikinase